MQQAKLTIAWDFEVVQQGTIKAISLQRWGGEHFRDVQRGEKRGRRKELKYDLETKSPYAWEGQPHEVQRHGFTSVYFSAEVLLANAVTLHDESDHTKTVTK